MNPWTRVVRALRLTLLVCVTPLMEKNPVKTIGAQVPIVFSMSRLILVAFAVAMFQQIWRAGVVGWPEALVCIAIAWGMPILGGLERMTAKDVVTIITTLLGRFGIGPARGAGSVYSTEPSKFDDHRNDAAVEAAPAVV